MQFPGGQARALQYGTSFINEHMQAFARLVRHIERSQPAAQARGRQRARVAMGQQRRLSRDQLRAVAAHRQAGREIFIGYRLGFALDKFDQIGQ